MVVPEYHLLLCLLVSHKYKIREEKSKLYRQLLPQASQPCCYTDSQVLAIGQCDKAWLWDVGDTNTGQCC